MAVLPMKSFRLTGAPDWMGRVKSGAASPTWTLLFAGWTELSCMLMVTPLCDSSVYHFTLCERVLICQGLVRCEVSCDRRCPGSRRTLQGKFIIGSKLK